MNETITYTAFESGIVISSGSLSEVVTEIKKKLGKSNHASVLIFNDLTGRTMDFNFQGSEKDVQKRLQVYTQIPDSKTDNSGPGRPKLGVISREVSLLPRHWEWLASQTGGASATLRRLIEEAKKTSVQTMTIKQAQERTYHFMSVVAGDYKGYEEVLRALYKKDKAKFFAEMSDWPEDIVYYIRKISEPVF